MCHCQRQLGQVNLPVSGLHTSLSSAVQHAASEAEQGTVLPAGFLQRNHSRVEATQLVWQVCCLTHDQDGESSVP